jgi:hypothetical protein
MAAYLVIRPAFMPLYLPQVHGFPAKEMSW